MPSPVSVSACTCRARWRRIWRAWCRTISRSSRPHGIRASCRGERWRATASNWSCGMWRAIEPPSRRGSATLPRTACPTGSASSASAAMAAMWRRRWRCSPVAGCAATSVRCCSRPRVRSFSTACWRPAWPTAAGIAAWRARSGCWRAAAASSAPSPGAARWRSAWRISTSIRRDRCGGRVPPARKRPPATAKRPRCRPMMSRR